MAYSELLADRVRQALYNKKAPITEEKKMFGGLCFMVDGKMCVGITGEKLMARIGQEKEAEAYSKKGAIPMDFTKRPMKGYVFVEPERTDLEEDLDYWVDLCLDFNPKAKVSKKRKKK